jgi:serine/threonine protein kinase
VKFIENFSENNKYYIVLEYCPCGDLEKLKNEKKSTNKSFTEDELTKIYTKLADALFYLHQYRKILHRDIKSQNVFVRNIETLDVCLGDFGVAKQTIQKTHLNITFAGTPLYLAPEQLRSEPYNDKADIWSLGVLFYELAALDYPFKANSVLALANVVVDQK